MVSLLLGLVVAYSIFQNPTGDGAQMAYVGMAMNFVAISTNGWQMPVFAQRLTEEKIDKYDPLHRHKLGDANTNFKILCDWIDFGYAILSPGDVFTLFGAFYNVTGFQFVKNKQGLTLKYQFQF